MLADPVLEIRPLGHENTFANNDWRGTAADNSRDAALILELPPGAYTATVSGKNNTTGVALVEVYELP
jgi:hypothetical protein